MKVYIVKQCIEYEDSCIYGVYADKQHAEKVAEMNRKEAIDGEFFVVREYEVK